MASILGRYGQAREDGFFKNEQEADIQELRKRMMLQGKFTQEYLGSDAMHALSSDSDDAVSPVLMEVLQASSRLSVPDAAKRRVWELRRRAGLPPLPDADLAKAIRQLKFGSAALAVVPSGMSLSTANAMHTAQRSSRAAEGPLRYESRYEMSPERLEVAKRQFALGLRTAAYGTGLTALLCGGIVTAIAYQCDLRSWEDCRLALRAWGTSCRPWLQDTLRPWRDYMQRSLGARPAGPAAS